MRKKINVIVILLLAVCLLTLVACQPGRDENGLLKPKTPQNLALSGSALSWDEVEHAERYYIYVEGEEKASTTSTTYDLSPLVSGYGDFNITVSAYGDGEKYGMSDTSKSIVYHKGYSLDAPIVSVDKNAKIASWQSVENAAEYSVVVYNSKDEVVNQTVTSQNSYSFADKTDSEGKDVFENFDKYRITVIAKPDQNNSKYSDSVIGSAYYFNSTVLSAPAFSNLNASRIQWGTVTNAKSYTLKLVYKGGDGSTEEKEITTTGSSYQRSNFNYDKVGDYYFFVKANGDNEVYYDSEWSEENETYKVSKLQGINQQEDIEFSYDSDGKARLTWSIDANTTANQFYLSLKGLLPDGTSKLENSETSMTISCNVVYVTGKVYNLYQYANSNKNSVEKVEGNFVLYNMEGDLKVRYNSADYNVENSLGEKMRYSSYIKSEGVDIVYADNKFIYSQNIQIEGGEKEDQSTGEDEELFDLDSGNRLCYFEEDTSDENVEKSVIFNNDHEPEKYFFAIDIDSIFIKEVVETPDDGEPKTTYEYKINDPSYYGILYSISVSAGHSSNNYVASAEAEAAGKYLSYKIPNKKDDIYEINEAGEYAYIVLRNYIDLKNGITVANNYKILKNINFNGYEVTQIALFKDKIDGNYKTLSNMVVGNSQLTEDGVVVIDEPTQQGDKVNKYYSMYLAIDSTAQISNAFYMGINYIGYDKEDVEENVEEIYVAPIAIDNRGTLDRVFVQSDSIKADSATVAGMVINNYSAISNSQVYADLSGRTVAGLVINNIAMSGNSAAITDSGFYGNIDASVGEFIESQLTYIAGAGLVVENKGEGIALINNCEAIGTVKTTATNLDNIYAGGLVAVNNGQINRSFSGEYTRYNVSNRKEVIANGNNSYAGGLVAVNGANGKITNSYSTNRVTANCAGGFVGSNSGSIESAYALGGTSRGGRNNGAFAGINNGTIDKAAAYSSDTWAVEEDYFTLIKQESQLGSIINVLYPGSDRQMTLTEKDGFRYPILMNRTYTKDYVVEMSPSQIPEVDGIAVIGGEVKDMSIIEEDIYGDRGKRGNKVVIVLNYKEPTSGGNFVKLIYGIIR